MTPFQVMQMSGKAAAQVNIFDCICDHTATPGTSSYTLSNSGSGGRSLAAGGSATWTWLLQGLNTDYQVRATYQSGNTPTGDALSSWLSLGTTRSWSLSVGTGGGTKDGFILVEIRRVSDSVVIDSATVEISVG